MINRIAAVSAFVLFRIIFAVDGLGILACVLSLLALGGLLNHVWPSSYVYLAFTSLGIAIVMIVLALVIIPLANAADFTEYDD